MSFAALQGGLNVDLPHLQITRGFKGQQGGELMKRAPKQFRIGIPIP
jgi:hypothetical protein